MVVDGIRLPREGLIDAMVLDGIDTEDIRLLERPRRDVLRKLPVA